MDTPAESRLDRLRRAASARLGPLRHLPALFRLALATDPRLTAASLALRLLRAGLPALMLYIAKLVVDAVVAGRAGPPPEAGWLADPRLHHLGMLVGIELGLAVLSDLLGRATAYVDGVLAEKVGNATSLRLMTHAAALDLEQFEDSAIQDRLERARRQVAWRSNLIGQLLGQLQDLVTAITLAVAVGTMLPGLVLLLVLALIPAFLNELHFNGRGYRLAFRRSPDRRETDYLRYLGADAASAKEVKLFGLAAHLAARFRDLAARLLAENRELARHRALAGGAFATLGTLAYYAAYLVIAGEALAGTLTVGDLTFLGGAFLRLRGLVEGLLLGASQVMGQAQYLDDLFSFFTIAPTIRSGSRPVPERLRTGFVFEDVGYRYPARAAGRCATSRSRSGPARWWRWWARTAPARPRSSSCSRGSTPPPRGASSSMAATSPNTTSSPCAPGSA